MPIVAGMNYREHLLVPSAVRIEVSVAGRPDWDRTIELPQHSPQTWLWEAYLLSIGIEACDDDVEALRYTHPDVYCGESWMVSGAWSAPFAARPGGYADDDFFGDEPPAFAGSEVRVPSFPYDLEITVDRAPGRQVGDANVSIVDACLDSSLQPSKDWQTSAQPLTLSAPGAFGLVTPHIRAVASLALQCG